MSDYQVGDRVFHIEHGAGVLVDRRRFDMGKQPQSYYVVRLSTGSTLMIPVDQERAIDLLSPLISPESLVELLASPPGELSADFRVRQQEVSSRLSSGNQEEMVGALRDLLWREYTAHLSAGDRRMLEVARKRLQCIVAAQTNVSVDEAAKQLASMLKQALKRWQEDHQTSPSQRKVQ